METWYTYIVQNWLIPQTHIELLKGSLKKGPFLLPKFIGRLSQTRLKWIILPIWSGKPILVCRFFYCPEARPIGHGRSDSPCRQDVTQWKEVSLMPKLSKKEKNLLGFFLDPKTGKRRYNELCRRCIRACKQSFRAALITCPRYISRHAKAAKHGELASNARKERG